MAEKEKTIQALQDKFIAGDYRYVSDLMEEAWDAAYAAAMENAVQIAEDERAPNDNIGDYNLACSRIAAKLRKLGETKPGKTGETQEKTCHD